MKIMEYRELTDGEIRYLETKGCFSENWKDILVGGGFNPEFCRNAHFSGKVKIGETGKKIKTSSIIKDSGIYNAHIHNCFIGDGVYISNIGTHIANYKIGDNTIIENSDTIEVRAKSSFGNGTKVSVLDETGGRSIPIFTGMSAQFAYFFTFYRHNKKLICRLEEIAQSAKTSFESEMGKIGIGVKITNAGTITDCNVGDFAQILNSSRLHNGNIESSAAAPVRIGTGVIADHFLIHEGSSLLDRATISHCFVGEGCDLSRGFSAENSLFFANFTGHHGETSAIFAGPHTVTHHKSSLLISGYFLFNNAGSGSNQSNHLYKMGPLHQGVFERGTKTASNSYVLYPARTGPFTLITGRHVNHCDTKNLPYSYLTEQANQSILIPGTNLRKVGTIRDADKWKTRDRRKGKHLDIINYDLLSPFSVSRMLHGKEILYEMKVRNAKEFVSGFEKRAYKFNGTIIPEDALTNGIRYYDLGIIKYLGNVFVNRLLDESVNSAEDLQKIISTDERTSDEWFDIAGCLVPRNFVEKFIEKINRGEINTVESFNFAIKKAHDKYDDYSWEWCIPQIRKYYGKSIEDMTKNDFVTFLDAWFASVKELDECFLDDAKKEYSEIMKIGFGIDGDEQTTNDDFDEVRGEFDNNEFVKKIHLHLEKKRELYEQAKEIIKSYL
jgi:NDP-sugar pyrophosphorylase family protein